MILAWDGWDGYFVFTPDWLENHSWDKEIPRESWITLFKNN
jgi:hypothetical protein